MAKATAALLDTNILIYLYRAYDPNLAAKIATERVAINRIIMVEALGWSNITADEETYLLDICKQADIFELTEAVFGQAIAIRKLKGIALPDALIAATAIEYKAVLWTANSADFAGIPNLKLLNPFA